jgi:hypothetical protein
MLYFYFSGCGHFSPLSLLQKYFVIGLTLVQYGDNIGLILLHVWSGNVIQTIIAIVVSQIN